MMEWLEHKQAAGQEDSADQYAVGSTYYDDRILERAVASAFRVLGGELEAVSMAADEERAASVAYLAATAVASAVSRMDDGRDGDALVHAVAIELEPLRYEPQLDGTLAKNALRICVEYRNWPASMTQAEAIERQLTRRWSGTIASQGAGT